MFDDVRTTRSYPTDTTRWPRPLKWAIASAILCASALALVLSVQWAHGQTATPPPAGYHFCTVRYVVDGDTVACNIAKSQWIMGSRISLRIAGIDTPEKTKVNAKCDAEVELGQAVTGLVRGLVPPGTVLKFYVVRVDKYGGRVDAKVLLPDGRDLGEFLIKSGHAKPYDGKRKPSWC